MHLAAEGGGAEEHRFAVDKAGDAALLIKAQIVERLESSALALQKRVEQAAQAALRGMGHRGGVGDDLAALLAVDLQPVQADRSRREQVGVGEDDAVAAAQAVRADIARQRAAGLDEALRQPTQRQRIAQRKGKHIDRREQHAPVPEEQQPLPAPQRGEHGKYERGGKQHGQQHALPVRGGVLPLRAARKALRAAAALGGSARGDGDEIVRLADRGDAEGIVHRTEEQRAPEQGAAHAEHGDGVERDRERGARGQEKVERRVRQRDGAGERGEQLICDRPRAELLEGINEHVASEDADKKLGNEERQAAEQPFLGEQRGHDAEMVEQQREPRERGDEQRGLRAAQAHARVVAVVGGQLARVRLRGVVPLTEILGKEVLRLVGLLLRRLLPGLVGIKPLGVAQPSAREKSAALRRQKLDRLLRLLVEHGLHGALKHLLQTHGVLRGLRSRRLLRRRGRLRLRRLRGGRGGFSDPHGGPRLGQPDVLRLCGGFGAVLPGAELR